MRFVSLVNGVVSKVRRNLSVEGAIGPSKDPAELAKTVRLLMQRVGELESRVPPEGVEFEVNVGTGGTLAELPHFLNGPVRWWVTGWMQTSNSAFPTGGPMLAQDSTSTANTLYLRSYVSGRAVIRVEPSQSYLDPGIIVPASPDNVSIALSSNFTTTSTSAVDTNLRFPVKAGETWRFHYVGGGGSTSVSGVKFAVNGPAGSTMDAWQYAATSAMTTRLYGQLATVGALGAAVYTVAGGERDCQIIGVMNAAIDGYLTIQAAAVAGTATIYAKACLTGKKVTLV